MRRQEILGIDEEDSLVGKLRVGIGDPIQISDPMEDTEVVGFVTAINTHKLTFSVENPDNPPVDESRDFPYKKNIEYDLRYFTKGYKLRKTMGKSRLIEDLEADFGDLIQFSNTKRYPKLMGYFISRENGSFKISIENPKKPAFNKSRDLIHLPNFKYRSKYFKYYSILNGEEEKKAIKKEELNMLLPIAEFN